MGKDKKKKKKLQEIDYERADIDAEYEKAILEGNLVEFKEEVKIETITWKRTITYNHLVGIIVGTVIGAGIFSFPANLLVISEDKLLALGMCAICTSYAMLGVYCYIDLAQMVPYNCCDYLFHNEFNGDAISFIWVLSSASITKPAHTAYCLLTASEYIIKSINYHCSVTFWVHRAIGILIILFVSGMQSLSHTFTLRFQSLTAIVAVVFIGMISFGCLLSIFYFGSPNYINEKVVIERSNITWIDFINIIYMGKITFYGWNNIACCVEEIREPKEVVVKAMWNSMVIIFICYLAMYLCFYSMLSYKEIVNSRELIPIALIEFSLNNLLFNKLTITYIVSIVSFIIAFISIGSANGIMYSSCRYISVAARYSHFPQITGYLNFENFTPRIAILVSTISTCCLIWLDKPMLLEIMKSLVCLDFILYGNLALSQIIYRVLYPEKNKGYRVTIIFPIMFCLFSYGLLGCIIVAVPSSLFLVLLLIVCSIPIYMLSISLNDKQGTLYEVYVYLAVLLQKVFMVLPDEKKRDVAILFVMYIKSLRTSSLEDMDGRGAIDGNNFDDRHDDDGNPDSSDSSQEEDDDDEEGGKEEGDQTNL